MSVEEVRRSKRLLLKNSTVQLKNHYNKQETETSLTTSDSDDEDVIYMGPKPLTVIDLTRSPSTLPSKKFVRKKSVLTTLVEQNVHRSPNKKKNSNESSPDEKANHDNDNTVTPPKQRKIANDENISAVSHLTPTVLLQRLALVDNEENYHKKCDESNTYQNARKALYSTYPTNMPGREKELGSLRDFILKHLNEGSSATLYISGPPGTGKTASLNLILQEEQISTELKNVYVNCTSVKSSRSIFSRIVRDLGIKTNGRNERDFINAIKNYLIKNHKTVLLVLDEIDQLECKNQSVLYTIFEWPSTPNSKLILIGIANALDLTDRILPRLQARCELKPQLMHFAPYSKQQIIDIFSNRLKNAGVLDIFSPVALQMLAGKVAAVSGDVRRALDIGRRVIELADRKKNGDNILKSMENLNEELKIVKTKDNAETVDLRDVMCVLNNVYGCSQNLRDDVDNSFPLQQKIVVCSLLLILKKAKNKDVTVGRLQEVYRKVCLKRNIQVIDQGEFVGLCSLIETKGIMKIIRKKDPRMSKIGLMWDEEEVAEALKDKQLMSMILEDDECLGKL